MNELRTPLKITAGLAALALTYWWQPVATEAAPAVIEVEGTVKAATKPPRPRSVTYKDAVIMVHLTGVKVLKGKLGAKELAVYTWGMRNSTWTKAASLKPGQKVRYRLKAWDKAERKYGSYNRFELTGNHIWDLDAYWGE